METQTLKKWEAQRVGPQHQENRNPVSEGLAIFGLCVPVCLSQLFGLEAMFHRGQFVVVVVAGAIL